jgi:hypothetical protein
MENEKTLQEDFAKKLLWSMLRGLATFVLCAVAGILPNFLLGIWELQRKGHSKTIVFTFFLLPFVGYILWGAKKGLAVVARFLWTHFFESFTRNELAPKLATALLQHIQLTPDEKLTGNLLIEKVVPTTWGNGVWTAILRCVCKTLINKHLFDIYKNADVVITQENLETEIFEKTKKIYREKAISLKTGNFLLDLIISFVLPFLIYLNIGLVLWYYLGV